MKLLITIQTPIELHMVFAEVHRVKRLLHQFKGIPEPQVVVHTIIHYVCRVINSGYTTITRRNQGPFPHILDSVLAVPAHRWRAPHMSRRFRLVLGIVEAASSWARAIFCNIDVDFVCRMHCMRCVKYSTNYVEITH